MPTSTATITNKTSFPINVCGWVNGYFKENIVMPGEQRSVTSDYNEWSIDTFFNDNKFSKIYDIPRMHFGKFRNIPCASGNYSWMDTENFNIIHEEGTFHFVKK
jgi:hypothetical protein